MHAVAADIEVSISIPHRLIKIVINPKHIKNEKIYTNTDIVTFSGIFTWPIFNGITRLGSIADKKYFRKNALTTCQRNIFIEPLVDPVQPPIMDKNSIIPVIHTPQAV